MYTFDEMSDKIDWRVVNYIVDKLTKYEDAGLKVNISVNTKCHQNGKLTPIWDNINQFHTVNTKPKYTYRGIFYNINVEDTRLSRDFSTTNIVKGLKNKFNIHLDIDVYSKFYCLFSIDNSFMAPFRRDYLNENNKSKR